MTVGAVAPSTGASYAGHGKPADISGVGSGYPSSYNASSVGGQGSNFSGTSNATPQVAGAYSKALYEARRALPGPSRIQEAGIIAVQSPDPERGDEPFECGEMRPDCELADGMLTAVELRTRLFHGAVHTPAGMTVGGIGPSTPPIGEDEFLNEGHGTYFGKLRGAGDYAQELAWIIDPMLGEGTTLTRPDGEREWMIVDSFCRQEIWGNWGDGYFVRGQTPLPGTSPSWPLRSTLEASCPHLFPPV